MSVLPPVPELFNFISAQARNDLSQMYGNYNMGAGYAIYVSEGQADAVRQIATKCGFQSWVAGRVGRGPGR